MGVTKKFKLDDGSITTVAEVMSRTGLAYAGSVNRLRLFTNPDQVFEPRKQQGIPKVQLSNAQKNGLMSRIRYVLVFPMIVHIWMEF